MKPVLHLPRGPAVCYSGYREGQSPGTQIFPSIEEIREDLLLVARHWRLIRLYDCSLHAERVLEVIRSEGLPLQVMLGAYLGAEVDNPNCPWGGGRFDAQQLEASRAENEREIDRLIDLAGRYRGIVFSVAVGNEATVDWTDHLVPVANLIGHVRRVKRSVTQPVTFCENYVPWRTQLASLVPELDFISIHTYPLWEYRPIEEALAYTQDNVESVAKLHPGTPVVITEAGWATRSNGRGMHAEHATPAMQSVYLRELAAWTESIGLLCFVFEAFDEPWKGSPDPLEPEKHWGLHTVDRRPKPAMRILFPTPEGQPASR